jgi:hypothetical protein
MMRAMIRHFDAWLARRIGVFEFVADPACIARLQLTHAHRLINLSDCTVRTGDPVVILHLWNEHLPVIGPGGADLAWARQLQRSFTRSLQQAAAWISQHPEASQARAFGGMTGLFFSDGHSGGARWMERLGFALFPSPNPLGRFGIFWENFYSYALIWAYNPESLQQRSLLGLQRTEMWISMETFLKRYGVAPEVVER